jgi:hypothetical protein
MRKLLLLLVFANLWFLANCGGGASSGSTGGTGTEGPVVLQSIQLNPSAASIAPGTTQAFTAMGKYSDGSTKDLTLTAQWSCLLSNLASVSNTAPTQGLALGVAPGSALISASMGGVSNGATLTIKGGLSVTSLLVSPAKASLGYGNQQQFTATAMFSDMTQQDVTDVSLWNASPLFVTSHSGLVIADNVGTGNMVQATFGGGGSGSATLSVDVSNLVSVSVVPATASIANHTALQYAALGTFNDGSTRDVTSLVTWSSSDPTIASFGFTGSLLTARLPGPATITAAACTQIDPITLMCTGTMISGSTSLNVTSATLNSIVVYPVNDTIAPTTKLGLRAIGVFSDSTTQDLTTQLAWATLDHSVATVESPKGIVTAASPMGGGSTTVSATASGMLGFIHGSTQINVTSATLSSIALKPANTFISPGATLTYSATGMFSDNSVQDVSDTSSWASEFTNVATVSSAMATGQGLGQSNITAKLKSLSGTVVTGTTNLKIASPKQISVASALATVQIAAQTSSQLTVTGTFVDGSTQDLTTAVDWTSSSASVATVGAQTGIVSGLAPGKSTITATLGPISSTIQVTVTNASLASINLSPANPSIALGSSQLLMAMGKFSDGSTQTLLTAAWSSSSPAIAVVDGSGLATSAGAGTATIKATLSGISGTTNLTVH